MQGADTGEKPLNEGGLAVGGAADREPRDKQPPNLLAAPGGEKVSPRSAS
jgi:hypothetical protein